ncbi:MAG: ABC transporter permease subunit [Chitinivibrionales bacterium]|nr:ABC transporter permease subunit [Chitinivibrionales bacterium]MBD3397441.1 ABC transporter permease subunit [Chitinivibrionales bacterium]
MPEETCKRILIAAGAALLLVFALSPFFWMLWVSLTSRPDFLFTKTVEYTLANYTNVLTSPTLHFTDYFRNSLIVASVTAVAVTLIASVAGYAVSRMRFPGRVAIPLFVLAMSMFPPISIVGYLYQWFSSLGLVNTHAALIFPYSALTVSLALWINMSYFAQIPVDLDRAALVDGASRMAVLFKIVFPLALPGIFSAFLLVFIACFNEFLFALMLTIDPFAQTLPVGIALFEGLHGEVPWGNLMAASAMATLPLVALTLIFQKYIVQGLMGGAVKG